MAQAHDLKTLAERLRYARTLRGIGSRELARKAGLASESHTSRIEGGRQKVDVNIVAALAAALEVPLDWLVSGGPEPKSLQEPGGAPSSTAFPSAPAGNGPISGAA